jgi:hypothetical protein
MSYFWFQAFLLATSESLAPQIESITINDQPCQIITQIASYPGLDVLQVQSNDAEWVVKKYTHYYKHFQLSFVARQHEMDRHLQTFHTIGFNALDFVCTNTMLAVRAIGSTMEEVFQNPGFSEKRTQFIIKTVANNRIFYIQKLGFSMATFDLRI